MRILIVVLFMVFLPLSAYGGGKLYLDLCASCHHEDRIGKTAPPLLPIFLRKYTDDQLKKIVIDGLPATQMPAFSGLTDKETEELIRLMRRPSVVKWDEKDITGSLILNEKKSLSPGSIRETKNLLAVVERGTENVWLMEGEDVIDKFEFGNVHGGIKYSLDGKRFFVPSRDGWIGRYDIGKGFYGKVRAGIYLRNISLSRDGKHVIAASVLPQGIVILDSETLMPVSVIKAEGNISAIYELHSRDEALFTFRDKPLLGILNTKSLSVEYKSLEEPFEDFFIDPFERFVAGTSRNGSLMRVFDIEQDKYVFEYPTDGLPHLFSASIWYNKGDFYFGTRHMNRSYMTVWKMYDWAFVSKVEVGGNGFLVRTHANTPYLWIDNGSDEVVLVDKKSLSVKRMIPEKGKKMAHTEFSGDGSIAYISIYDMDGALILYDASTLREIKRIPAKLPAGKYNFIGKLRRYDPVQLGRQVFMAKCWGCHHQTEEAFGPSFRWIAKNRVSGAIRAHILNPEKTFSYLGYKRSVMPKINLKKEEIEAVMSYMEVSGEGLF